MSRHGNTSSTVKSLEAASLVVLLAGQLEYCSLKEDLEVCLVEYFKYIVAVFKFLEKDCEVSVIWAASFA
jgi:hypothetical protein